MNKIYKVIWSKAKNCYVVASELAKSHTKAPKSGVMSRALVAGVLACVLSCGAVLPKNALAYTYNNQTAIVTELQADANPTTITNNSNVTVNGNVDLPIVTTTTSSPHLNVTSNSNLNVVGGGSSSTYNVTVDNTYPTEIRYFERASWNQGRTGRFNTVRVDYFLTEAEANSALSNYSSMEYADRTDGLTMDPSVVQYGDLWAIGYPVHLDFSHSDYAPITEADYVQSGSTITLVGSNSTNGDITLTGGTLVVNGTSDVKAKGNISVTAVNATNSSVKANSITTSGAITANASDVKAVTMISGGGSLTETGVGQNIQASSITASNGSTLSAKNITTTTGDLDATGSEVDATESVQSAGVIKAGRLNAPVMLGAGNGMSQLGGGLTVAGQIKGVSAGTEATDAVNLGQMQQYVAENAGSGGTADGNSVTHMYAGSGTAANAATTNGNTKLTVVDDSTVRNSITIKGTGGAKVTSDANGVITIDASDAAGTTYSAGNGIAISGSTISAKATNGIQLDSNGIGVKAGTNVTVNANGVSVTGNGSVASGNTGLISGGTAYSELRPASNGSFVKSNQTTAQNLTALDTAGKNAIKGLSVSGTTITYTKGDGTTGTITTQDTTYGTGSAANLTTGTDTTAKVWTSKVLADYVSGKVSAEATARSNADTALGTRIDNEATTRSNADTALSNRIGTLSADGNIIKKSATNSVSANLQAIDTKIGALAADGNYVKNEYTVMRNINSIDSKLGNGDFTDGHFVETNTTFTGNIKRLDNRLNTAVNDLTNEINNRLVAQNAETLARSTEDTNLSNRIGVIEDAGYNYIRPSSESDIASNLLVLDTTLKQTNDTVAQNKLTIENAFNDAVQELYTADTNILNRLDLLEAGDVYYDSAEKNSITLQGSGGTLLTNVKNGVLSLGSTDAVTGHQLYQTNQALAVEVQNRLDAVQAEADTRSAQFSSLSNRIGSLDADGNFVRASSVYDISQNLQALDNALKATNDNIVGFAADINRNKQGIRELNTSMTAALDSVAISSTLVDTIDVLKADANLNNLTAAGKRVIATVAANAVQEYFAAQQNSEIPMAPMAYAQAPNTLTVTDAGNGSLHVGEGSYVNGTSSIAIGVGNQVNANNSGAFGDPSIIDADESYILGNDDRITANAKGSFIVGNDSKADAEGSLILGSNVESTGKNGLALGNNTNVSAENAVALGFGSVANEDNSISVGNADLKRRIINVADGTLGADSSDVVTGSQLFATNEKLQQVADDVDRKAEANASNIDVAKWSEVLGTGEVAQGNTGLVNGGTVYEAMNGVANAIINASPVKTDGENIFIGAEMGGRIVSVMNKDGESRVITGVATNPEDASSAANVGYVNAVGQTIIAGMNSEFSKVNNRMNKIGANAAAMASLTPASFEGDEKWSLAASVGHYKGATAGAVGAFYKPAENVMLNVRGSFADGENMVGGGVSVSLNKGDVPGVTKRQLATKIQHMEQTHAAEMSAMKQEVASYQQQVAELKAMVESMAASK